jgi:hypothetical protein
MDCRPHFIDNVGEPRVAAEGSSMLLSLALIAFSHIVFALIVVSSLSCTIALFLHKSSKLAHKESHGLIINVTNIFIIT